MTLIDSRPGVKAALDALSARTGVHIDTDLVVTRLGPPLERELARWFPSWEIEAAAASYREAYATTCRTGTTAMPGAHAAFEAVRAAGGKIVVVTAKSTPLAADLPGDRRPGAGRGGGLAASAPPRARPCSSTGRASTSAITSGTSRAPVRQRTAGGRRHRTDRRGRPRRRGSNRRPRLRSTSSVHGSSITSTAVPEPPSSRRTCAGWAASRSPSPAAPTRPSCWLPPYGRSVPKRSSPSPLSRRAWPPVSSTRPRPSRATSAYATRPS